MLQVETRWGRGMPSLGSASQGHGGTAAAKETQASAVMDGTVKQELFLIHNTRF